MWSELFAANKDVLLEQMNLFIGKFNELKAILHNKINNKKIKLNGNLKLKITDIQ